VDLLEGTGRGDAPLEECGFDGGSSCAPERTKLGRIGVMGVSPDRGTWIPWVTSLAA